MDKQQLTKAQLQSLIVGSKITEKYFNETYNWEVKNITDGVYHLQQIGGKKRTKLTVDGNFNSEGDRRYKSADGQVIVKYYEYDSAA